MNKTIFKIIIIISICLGNLFSQFNPKTTINSSSLELTDNKYFVNDKGDIFINVNVWGHVQNPGSHLVYDGIDFTTILSIAGGTLPGANLSKVKLIRNNAEEKKGTVHIIDLQNFYETGDKSGFVEILPNDIIIVQEKVVSAVFRSSNMLTTILQILNIYLQIKN